MFTRLTTTLMAGALVLASFAAPTQAHAGNDAGKVIAGLAVGAIIGAAIVGNNKHDRHDGRYVSRGYQSHGGGYARGHSAYGKPRHVYQRSLRHAPGYRHSGNGYGYGYGR